MITLQKVLGMEIIHGIHPLNPSKKLILTIGMFDGVHRGHQSIIQQLNRYAEETGGHSALLSFTPHPRQVLQPDGELKLLSTLEEKLDLLCQYHLDYAIIHPFTVEFSRLSAVEFVRDYLVNHLQIHTLLVGYDHHFGRNRMGDFQQLEELADLYNFQALQLSAVLENDLPISSTKIRNALLTSDIDYVTEALGHFYPITGKVIHGYKIGRKLGFPTINMAFSKDKLLPADGVYGVRVELQNQLFFGLMNIGKSPTFDFKEQRVEVYLLDFDGEVYDETVKADILCFIRGEKKFENAEALKNQIQRDEAYFHSRLHEWKT